MQKIKATINFTIPKIEAKVLHGVSGRSAYKIAVEKGFVGTIEEWLDSLKGQDGKDGQEVELRVDNGYIQWKYENSGTWNSLISLPNDIKDLTDSTDLLFSKSYNDLTNKPTIPTELSDLSDDSNHRLVTDTEKNTWNAKVDKSELHSHGNKTVLDKFSEDILGNLTYGGIPLIEWEEI